MDRIYETVKEITEELIEKAKLKAGAIVVVGCSTSEVVGSTIGTNSNVEVASELFKALNDFAKSKGIYLAVQCCEHLNRALIIEKELADKLNIDIVNAVPQPKAGGSSATTAYARLDNPVVVEHIRADAGIDIGGTLIGMHLKETAVPLRLKNRRIGEAYIAGARVRAKFIGGERAVYNDDLM